jgi:hypothetical protein
MKIIMIFNAIIFITLIINLIAIRSLVKEIETLKKSLSDANRYINKIESLLWKRVVKRNKK